MANQPSGEILHEQTYCAFRDQAHINAVVYGVSSAKKELTRLVCKESHPLLAQLVVDYVRGKEYTHKLNRYLRKYGKERHPNFVHLFSMTDKYGMLYHTNMIKRRIFSFSVPLCIIPHAGPFGCLIHIATEDMFVRRLERDVLVRVLFERDGWLCYDHIRAHHHAPRYIHQRLTVYLATTTRERKFKKDCKRVDTCCKAWTRECNDELQQRLQAWHVAPPASMDDDGTPRTICAWPPCDNIESLPTKKFPYCGRCERVQYCSKQCQTEHHKFHQAICKSGLLGKYATKHHMCAKRYERW